MCRTALPTVTTGVTCAATATIDIEPWNKSLLISAPKLPLAILGLAELKLYFPDQHYRSAWLFKEIYAQTGHTDEPLWVWNLVFTYDWHKAKCGAGWVDTGQLSSVWPVTTGTVRFVMVNDKMRITEPYEPWTPRRAGPGVAIPPRLL